MDHAYGAGVIRALGADRGFGGGGQPGVAQGPGHLRRDLPRDPARLKERMAEETFCATATAAQPDRGRIGIFKNGFFGPPMRAKGFEHRDLAVNWQVLTHNLWVLARMEQRAALAQAA